MAKKNRKKIKPSRHKNGISMVTLFPKKEEKAVHIKEYFLSKVFPRWEDRKAYIKNIIWGLDNEPIIPEIQFSR